MQKLRKILVAALVIAAFGSVQAQSPESEPAEPEDKPLGIGADSQARLSPREMEAQAQTLLTEMEAIHRRVVELQIAARKQKDIIKLNCVNDKLLQVKQLLNIAESSRANMVEAIATGKESERYHHFTALTVASDKMKALRDEAEACIGEELVFLGPTSVEVDKPHIIDDPTVQDPFDLSGFGFEIERPTYATPFL